MSLNSRDLGAVKLFKVIVISHGLVNVTLNLRIDIFRNSFKIVFLVFYFSHLRI